MWFFIKKDKVVEKEEDELSSPEIVVAEGKYRSWTWDDNRVPYQTYNRQVRLVQSPSTDDKPLLTVTARHSCVPLSGQQFEALREIMKAYEETQ